ncbi:glycosyltransferase family 2 protein [Algibacter sp. PT7-4]|uniref:glycosyltransferase family 2 protein n=1 Tax=Algibacter ulvanivorans TaxID=3400999 RepID=UPI003AAA65C4
MPFFSIIIPLYNKEKYIKDTLNSILSQTFNDFEIIIIDDGSTDNSFKIASEFKDERIQIIRQNNTGVSIARNNGIKVSKGKYIALLDADDTWYTNHLYELKKLILLFPNAGLFCNNYEVYYNTEFKKAAQFNFKFNNNCLIVKDYFKASIINSVAWTSAVAFSKENFYLVGGFKEQFTGAEDLDLWIRFALKFKTAFNPTITMSYKLYVSESLSKTEFNAMRYDFINNFNYEENLNASLKLYLDINRYAAALRSKVNGDINIYKKLKSEIKYSNLNLKQKILLNTPRSIIKLAKKVQNHLIKRGIYYTAFK